MWLPPLRCVQLEAEAAEEEIDDITSEVEDALDDFLKDQARRKFDCVVSSGRPHDFFNFFSLLLSQAPHPSGV